MKDAVLWMGLVLGAGAILAVTTALLTNRRGRA